MPSSLFLDPDVVIQGAKKLSPAPQILPKLHGLLKNEYASLDDITELIRLDGALSSQIIKLGNSAFFGARSSAKSIDEACNRLGFKEIYRAVTLAASKEALGRGASLYGMDSATLWEYSLAVALFMEDFAKHSALDNSTAYTVGLLHALGQVIISEFFCEHPQLECPTPPLALEQEKALLGLTSAQVARAMFAQWNFPVEISEPIAYQREPLEAPKFKKMSAILYIGTLLTSFIFDGLSSIERTLAVHAQIGLIKKELNISTEQIVEAVRRAHNQYLFLRGALNGSRS